MSARSCISCCRKARLGKWHICRWGAGPAQERFSGSGSSSLERDENRCNFVFIPNCFQCESLELQDPEVQHSDGGRVAMSPACLPHDEVAVQFRFPSNWALWDMKQQRFWS